MRAENVEVNILKRFKTKGGSPNPYQMTRLKDLSASGQTAEASPVPGQAESLQDETSVILYSYDSG